MKCWRDMLELVHSFQAISKISVKSQLYIAPQAQLTLLPQSEVKVGHQEYERFSQYRAYLTYMRLKIMFIN